jgi:hypothetical protein
MTVPDRALDRPTATLCEPCWRALEDDLDGRVVIGSGWPLAHGTP